MTALVWNEDEIAYLAENRCECENNVRVSESKDFGVDTDYRKLTRTYCIVCLKTITVTRDNQTV